MTNSEVPSLTRRLRYAILASLYVLIPGFFVAGLAAALVDTIAHSWLVAVVFVGYVVVSYRSVSSRLKFESDIRAAAVTHGWSYQLWGPTASRYRIAQLPFGEPGGLRTHVRVQGTIHGKAFESLFVDRASQRLSQAHYVQLLHLDQVWPSVSIAPRAWYHRDMEGRPAIETESAEFNRRWLVHSDYPEFAHALLSPRVMARLLYDSRPPHRVVVSGKFAYVSEPVRGRHVADRTSLLFDMVAAVPLGIIAKYVHALPRQKGAARSEPVPAHPTRRTQGSLSRRAQTALAWFIPVVSVLLFVFVPWVAVGILGVAAIVVGRSGKTNPGCLSLGAMLLLLQCAITVYWFQL